MVHVQFGCSKKKTQSGVHSVHLNKHIQGEGGKRGKKSAHVHSTVRILSIPYARDHRYDILKFIFVFRIHHIKVGFFSFISKVAFVSNTNIETMIFIIHNFTLTAFFRYCSFKVFSTLKHSMSGYQKSFCLVFCAFGYFFPGSAAIVRLFQLFINGRCFSFDN